MMRYLRLLLGVILSILLCVGGIASAQDELTRPDDVHTLEFAGVERWIVVHTPPDGFDSPRPLLIALHPSASSGRAMQLMTGLDDAADTYGFVTVYPTASGLTWGEDATNTDAPDDIGFMDTLVSYMVENFNVDATQVYVAGWGNGGLMALRLACEVPDRFAGIAVTGALMWGRHRGACPQDTDVSTNFLLIHGTNEWFYTTDTHFYRPPFGGDRPLILGVDDTLSVWLQRGQCDVVEVLNENARIARGCNDDTTVAHYSVIGGSSWPRSGDYVLNTFGVDAATIIVNYFVGDDSWSTPQVASYTEVPRTWVMYVPSTYNPETPTPLVMGLHGRYGTGVNMASLSDYNPIAEREGFILVYPDGLNYEGSVIGDFGWNYTRGFSPRTEPDDVAFISTLIEDTAIDVNIDRSRLYVTGISNGGFMVHRLACEAPSLFAAYADVAGSGFYGMEQMCFHDVPVPMLIMHGTADNNVLWDGIQETISGQRVYTSYPILSVMGFWVQHNGCSEEADVIDLPELGNSPGTQVRIVDVNDCPNGAQVILYGVLGGGHNWPGIASNADRSIVGTINMDIHASEVIWEFFSQHSRVTDDE